MCEKKKHYNAYASSSLGQEMHPMNFFSQIQITKMLIHFNESKSEVAQSCPTLCNPVDCSPPGSSIHGILQARILEWVAISNELLGQLNH